MENTMLNDLLKNGAILYTSNTILMFESIIKFKAQDSIFELEIITTPAEYRKTGSASAALKALCKSAIETDTTIQLVCGIVKQKGIVKIKIDLAGNEVMMQFN